MMLTHWYVVNVPVVVAHFEFYIVFVHINMWHQISQKVKHRNPDKF